MRVRKDAAGLYVIHKGVMVRPYERNTPTICLLSSFSDGDIVKRAITYKGSSNVKIYDKYREEIWSTINGMNIDTYRYCRDHYFKSKDDFNTFIKNWDVQMSTVMISTEEYRKLIILYGEIIDAKKKFDANQIRIKKIKTLNNK